MKFNPTPLECILFIFVCLAIYIWTKHGRFLRRWLRDYFRQRRGPRNLKPKSPVDCPACNRDCSILPNRLKLDRPKTIDTSGHACFNPLCAYFAIADLAIHALVSNGRRGKQRIRIFLLSSLWRLQNQSFWHTLVLIEDTIGACRHGHDRHV
jgi:hypothetical protein